jgi:alpha-L-fucosidase
MGNVERVEVGFQYRVKKDGTDLSERIEPWTDLPTSPRTTTGGFTFTAEALAPNREYEFRAQVKHPLLTTYGQEKTFRTSDTAR